MYKAVIFDFFGVIHSDPANRWFQNHSLEQTGEFADVFKQVDYDMINMDQAYEKLSRLSGQSVEDIKQIFGQTDMIDHELIKLIKTLKSQYKIGLLSNAIGNYVREILQENGLTDLFEEIVISGDVRVIKPDPKIFELILDRLGIKPNEAVFIDDIAYNVDAANSLGIKGILFEGTVRLKETLEKL